MLPNDTTFLIFCFWVLSVGLGDVFLHMQMEVFFWEQHPIVEGSVAESESSDSTLVRFIVSIDFGTESSLLSSVSLLSLLLL